MQENPGSGQFFDGISFVQKQVECSGQSVKLWVVENPDSLLDRMTEKDFGQEEKMPYWAALWPAAEGLAHQMMEWGIPPGARVLELGCGLGLNGVFAGMMGARVSLTDWYHEAVRIAEENANLNGVTVEAFWMDWNRIPPMEPFDLILGSDILYEDRNHLPVLNALGSLLSANGEAWLSDPGRAHLSLFLDLAREKGWMVQLTERGKVQFVRMRFPK